MGGKGMAEGLAAADGTVQARRTSNIEGQPRPTIRRWQGPQLNFRPN